MYIGRHQLHPEIQEQLEELKKMHDYSYAKKCVLDKLEAEYQTMIDTDIWYKAAKEYLRNRISTSKFDSLLWDFKSKHELIDWSGHGICYAGDYGVSYVAAPMTFLEEKDIKFSVTDDDGEQRWMSINDMHQTKPDVELKDDFKMHCINYKRRYEE